MTLLDHIRLERRETGTKEGCNEGDCGACTVVLARLEAGRLSYRPVNACILLAGQIDGAELITIEDLASGDRLHDVQQAMVDHHASQCGFCTPGIVMSLFALYHGPRPVDRAAINSQLAGNLCRCTGYRPIVDAALDTCAKLPDDRFSAGEAGRRAALATLDDGADVVIGDDRRFFAAPARLDTLADLYLRHPDAVLIGGAQDVGRWITKKLKEIDKIIWLGRIRDLDRIETGPDRLLLGSGVRLADAADALADLDPDLGGVMRRFGSAQVRASGTVGGNIANGSPIGDLAPCLIALGASVTLQRGGKQRCLPLEQFFLAYGRQDRHPGEFVRMLTIPRLQAAQQFRAFKISKRFDEDISAVMGAFRLDVTEGVIGTARVAFGGMAATPKRAAETERRLAGLRLDSPDSWRVALDALAGDFSPISDMRATADYRRRTARALLEKALLEVAGAGSATTRLFERGEARR